MKWWWSGAATLVIVVALVLLFASRSSFIGSANNGATMPVQADVPHQTNTTHPMAPIPTTPAASPSSPSSTLSLTIPAFQDGGMMPSTYTCDISTAVSPAVEWSGVPSNTASYVLIMEDPDVPKALRPDGLFVHWVLYNIPPTAAGIPEGGSAGSAGLNSAGKAAYATPCPPPQYEPSTHRYIFTLYALDATLPLSAGATKEDVEKAMEGHIIAQARYTGLYKRQ